MPDTEEMSQDVIALLSSMELADAAAKIASLVQQIGSSTLQAIILWDSDLERLSDHFLFGSRGGEPESFLAAFIQNFVPREELLFELSSQDSFHTPIYCYQIKKQDELCACLVFSMANLDDERARERLLEKLSSYPFAIALSRAWELQELMKENLRLRNSYEEMEEKTSMLEEQTRKLIHDLTVRESIRTKHVERERLIYSISNVVRSYMDIQKVLETTVERIGSTFGVSRCLLLRPLDLGDRLTIYEYINEASSAKEIFQSPAGFAFAKTALSQTTPQDLLDSEIDTQAVYDGNFLRQLQIKSGLIVPLVMRERVLGALFLQYLKEARAWSIDDISLVGSLADQVSVAIENAELHQEKERQAVTDGLTGIANRRCFNDTFVREYERARRYDQPLSLVLIDLDFLKVINDTFGHQVGDEAIKEIARILKQFSRSIDLAARYGGEEFCLLLPNTDIEMAEQSAERIRKLINDVHIEGPGHISASLGVSNYPVHAQDAEILLRKADDALYEAKQAGRNLVRVATEGAQEANGKGVKKPSSRKRAKQK